MRGFLFSKSENNNASERNRLKNQPNSACSPCEAHRTRNPESRGDRPRSCSYLVAGLAAGTCGCRPWLRPHDQTEPPLPPSSEPLAPVEGARAGLKPGEEGSGEPGRGRFGEGRRNGAGGRGAVALGKFIGSGRTTLRRGREGRGSDVDDDATKRGGVSQ